MNLVAYISCHCKKSTHLQCLVSVQCPLPITCKVFDVNFLKEAKLNYEILDKIVHRKSLNGGNQFESFSTESENVLLRIFLLMVIVMSLTSLCPTFRRKYSVVDYYYFIERNQEPITNLYESKTLTTPIFRFNHCFISDFCSYLRNY